MALRFYQIRSSLSLLSETTNTLSSFGRNNRKFSKWSFQLLHKIKPNDNSTNSFSFLTALLWFSESSRVSHCSQQHLVELCRTPDPSWKEESHHARGRVWQTKASPLRLVKVDAEMFGESQRWNLVQPRDKNKQLFETQICFFIYRKVKQTWLIVFESGILNYSAGWLETVHMWQLEWSQNCIMSFPLARLCCKSHGKTLRILW